MQKEFKPKKFPFIFVRLISDVILSVVIFLFYFVGSLFVSLPISVFWWVVALVLLGLGFFCFQSFVVYNKRKYIFHDDRIFQYSGGIFSDSQTELLIKNITHVKRVYPFIEYGIFKTGHIRIEAAGSSESEVHINSVDNVEEKMGLVEEVMIGNGFNLSKEDLQYSENPHPLGVSFEVLKDFLITSGILIYVLFNLIFEIVDKNTIFVSLLIILFIPIIFWFVLRFLDLLRREYKIYSTVSIYTEGFLNKHYAFIPFKNLSDSATTQTIIDRILNLYDVKLSSQGSGHEILFKNLKRGKQVSETLDRLIEEYKQQSVKEREGAKEKILSQAESAKKSETRGEEDLFSKYETEFTDDFQINLSRHLLPLVFYIPAILIGVIFPPILFPLFIIIVVNSIPLLLQAKFTRYYIKKKSMFSKYKFISSKEVEFTNEKITGMVVKRNFIDYWFNTVTFRFYSIGSGSDLDFSHVDFSKKRIEDILAKLGLSSQKEVFNINSEFSFSQSLRAWFFLVLIIAAASLAWIFYAGNYLASQGYSFWLVLVPLIILAFIWLIIYIYQAFYYKRSKLFFYEDKIYFQRGIFFKDFFYSTYNNIKDITITQYPFSREGDLRFNIAGEKIVQQHRKSSIQSHHFKIKYVSDIPTQDELIDFILLRKPRTKQIKEYLQEPSRYVGKTLTEEKPSLKNPIFISIMILVIPNFAVLFLIFFVIHIQSLLILLILWLLTIDAIVLGAVSIYTLVKRYIVEDIRVLAKWGVFYKKQTSVVFGKINFLNNNQKIVNKLFKNGNITVNTLGSMRAELVIKNINGFQDFYHRLQKVNKNFDLDDNK